MKDETVIWALADERAGNRAQVLGVAARLGRQFSTKEIAYGGWARLPNSFLGASLLGVTSNTRAGLGPPWPDLVIAAGRRTAPVALAVKRKSAGRTRLVQIMNPGVATQAFDLIVNPAHDGPLAGDNVMTVVGAPNQLTPETLAAARAQWQPAVEEYPAPRVALIVGGGTRRRRFTDRMAEDLAVHASAMARDAGGSLLVTTSRRTGPVVEPLMAAIDCPHMLYRWGDPGENPYRGFLACADAIVVTGDSVSMCSEACATGVPVQIYAPHELITDKHARFHANLYEGGYAKPFSGELLMGVSPVLDVSGAVVRKIEARGLV